MKPSSSTIAGFVAALLIFVPQPVHAVEMLPNAHAHNDYLHTRPLMDALDLGFTSVEADVFPVGPELLVAHDPTDLKPERTLEKLYLAPLAQRARQNNGHIYPHAGRFFLLIDIKASPQVAYANLQTLLARFKTMLTVTENGTTKRGAITVVLTGSRPRINQSDTKPRYVGLDGRLSDLDSKDPADFLPMISEEWPKHFSWSGNGPMPDAERAKLATIVKKAHTAGRVVRFWKTPEDETVWRELRAAGVDLINTDQLKRLATFLRTNQASLP